ncbi:MAG TPA: hypothetical protein VI855_05445, partial [Dehalococcoidia bacterium]|nr:hypothetical protein [Dehalococcoidia bacterium]
GREIPFIRLVGGNDIDQPGLLWDRAGFYSAPAHGCPPGHAGHGVTPGHDGSTANSGSGCIAISQPHRRTCCRTSHPG